MNLRNSGIFLFAVFVLILFSSRLQVPEKEYYDEVYHVKTAREFIQLSGNTDTTHPPLGKLMMAGSILAFGDKPAVWRIPALFCGVLSLLIFLLLAEKFFGNLRAAFWAAGLLAIDGFSITQSRIAMLNTPMFLFMLLSLWFFIRFFEGKKKQDLFLMSLFLGLTTATRWVGLGILAVMVLVWAGKKISSGTAPEFKTADALKNYFAAFLIIAMVYFAAHLILPFIQGYHWIDILKMQRSMYEYHHNLKTGHGYGSSWWSWPLMTRPIWFFFERREEMVYGILCVGNPAVVWMFLPAAVYSVWHLYKTGCRKTLFALAGFLSQWLPWALIGRVKFFHYYYTAMPFVVLTLVLCLDTLWKSGKWGKAAAMTYGGLALVLFLYWYPLYTAYPISETFFRNHMWFKSWI